MSIASFSNATGRLDTPSLAALEAAVAACLRRTNYRVEPEHWLLALLRLAGGDVQRICRHYRVDCDVLDEQLGAAIDLFKRGDGSRRPEFSPQTAEMLDAAWLVASMRFNEPKIRGGHLLAALVGRPTLWKLLVQQSPELGKISVEKLPGDLRAILPESAAAVSTTPAVVGKGAAEKTGTPALDRFTVDLTALAEAGKLDAAFGRDAEVNQCVAALSRRRQNNPILVGDAGVGKTAIVEGLAVLLAKGKIKSPLLRRAKLRSLDLGALGAGAGVRGEFEERVRAVVAEVKASSVPIILFIDEAHMLLGAGGTEGQGDAANLFKPALARGEFRAIAATTWAEYKKFFEKDAALSRRFELVKVAEPDEATACSMLRAMLPALEKHHGVKVLDEAVTAAVGLSVRYLSGRQLPDKAVGLLDTAAAAVSLGTSTEPAVMQDARRRIEDADHSLRLVRREAAAGGAGADVERLELERDDAERELSELSARYGRDRQTVMDLREQWDVAADESGDPDERLAAREKIAALTSRLGVDALATPLVDRRAVADVVSRRTGIPLGQMEEDQRGLVLTLEQRLGERIVGQTHAVAAIAQTVRRSRAGLNDPGKPVGVFLLLGTSGVGKTETAVALADILYGGAAQLTTINMSEFKEPSKVSQLLGSSAGYVGYGEGGVLTEAVRRKPHSVLLLDEMEKASRAVHDIFLSAFDKGVVRDGEGRDIDFRNTLIVMTSNAAAATIAATCADRRPEPGGATGVGPGRTDGLLPVGVFGPLHTGGLLPADGGGFGGGRGVAAAQNRPAGVGPIRGDDAMVAGGAGTGRERVHGPIGGGRGRSIESWTRR